MLTLNCLGSGSTGNCYILSDEQGRKLILDCGIKINEVKKTLNFDLSNIVGVFATHEHSDHFAEYDKFVKMGCETLAPHLLDKIRVNKEFYPYSLQAFKLPHGETFSYGALIKHVETGETLLYMTDFEYCQFNFQACHINYYLVECNYQIEYVDLDAPNKEHKIGGHCSLTTCRDFVKANVNNSMRNVILCHLGVGSTDPRECINEVEKVVTSDVNVDYARPNTVYTLGVQK